jgi:hypothetical protein
MALPKSFSLLRVWPLWAMVLELLKVDTGLRKKISYPHRMKKKPVQQGQLRMPITYTNRKSLTYTLYRGQTRTGKPRYYFGRAGKNQGLPVMELPSGFKISGSVNGMVSLIKDRPSLIQPEEMAIIEDVINEHPQATRYRVIVRSNRIEIYENSIPDLDALLDALHIIGPSRLGLAGQLYATEERYTHYSPVLRFILHDPEQRRYSAERWCYRSRINGWLKLVHTGPLTELAHKLIPTLSTDQFFELY